MCAMRSKATRSSQSRLWGKKSSLFRSRFQAIFPGFISKSSGVENSILKEKWWGGGESWMKKEGGLRGYNPTTSKKSQSFSFSCVFRVYHFHDCRLSPKSAWVMMKMPRFRPVMSEMLINIWFECVPFHRLSSPFFRLGWGSATLLATEKRLHSTGHAGTNYSSQTSKEICLFRKSFFFFFFRRKQIVPTPSVAKLAADASCH